jgi:hypothetical protein
MKRVPVYSIGWIARDILSRERGFSVHSVFPKSIYVELQGVIVYDIFVSRIRSEVGVTIDDTDLFSTGIRDLTRYVSKGDYVIFHGDLLKLGENLELDLGKASIYIPSMRKKVEVCRNIYSWGDLDTLIKKIFNIAILIDKLHSEEIEILDNMLKTIYQLARIRGDSEKLKEILRKCIGLGRGLTPSCDDLVSGIITIYNIIATACREEKPIEIDPEDLRRTTDISAYILRNAVRGVLYEPVEKIIQVRESQDAINPIMDLISIGHSSGVMFSLGVLAGLSYIRSAIL